MLLSILLNEFDMIKEAQNGSVAAFNQLVMTYQSLAYNVAYRVMGNRESAADACQESFLKAYKSMHQYQGGSFKSWLLRIVTNTCYDQIRYRIRRPADSLEDLTQETGEDDGRWANHDELPEERMLRDELNDLLQQAINQLPQDQRTVLVLSDVQHLSYQEIAEVINQPLGTVKSRLSRARHRVRDFLLEHKELLPNQYR